MKSLFLEKIILKETIDLKVFEKYYSVEVFLVLFLFLFPVYIRKFSTIHTKFLSSFMGSEHYVSMLSFVDKDLIEPNCTVLLHHKVHAVIGVLSDDVDPLVSCMKIEKAPQESYADVGGLEKQIQEIKESVELPLTHPEYYEEMGIQLNNTH